MYHVSASNANPDALYVHSTVTPQSVIRTKPNPKLFQKSSYHRTTSLSLCMCVTRSHFCRDKTASHQFYSSLGCLMYASIAALNAANAAQPPTTACGPAFLARMPPVRHPAAMPLTRSFFARRPSMPHSIPENRPPTLPKFFAMLQDRVPMSLKPILSCWRRGSEVTAGWPLAPWRGLPKGVS